MRGITFFTDAYKSLKLLWALQQLLVRNSFAILAAMFFDVYVIMTMSSSFYKVIPLKVLLRILTEISFCFSLFNTVKGCFLCFSFSCHLLQTTNYISSQCFGTILPFNVVSCSFQRKHWAYCQYQAIEFIYITLSNQCHAAKNNFAVVMHVRTNPYLSCIEKKMSKTKTCNYTEMYTALREKAFWGEPGSICQVT